MTPTQSTLLVATLAAAAALVGCGGGGALGNAPDIQNPQGSSGRKLSFEYFQRCIHPIYLKVIAGAGGGSNTCSSSGCHDTVAGTGGALRIVPQATIVAVPAVPSASDIATIRASDMYKNYYSSQGVTIVGAPPSSRLFQKPLLLNVLHGGGQIFASQSDDNAKLIAYWITHPMPETQDEFGAAANALFTPADPTTGACNTQ